MGEAWLLGLLWESGGRVHGWDANYTIGSMRGKAEGAAVDEVPGCV